MSTTQISTFLRRVLLVDAASTAATGLLLIALTDRLADLSGLPAALLRNAGLSFLPFAALVAWVAARPTLRRPAVWAVIAYNAVWAVDSVLLLATGWVQPTALGHAFVVAQALFVATMAQLERIGLRRCAPALG